MHPSIHSPFTTSADMALARSWTTDRFGAAERLPISLNLAGRKISGIPVSWKPAVKRRRIDANLIEIVYTGSDPESGLTVRVEALEYQDFPAIEWTAWLTNESSAPTARIEDILGIDAPIPGESPILWHCNGDFCSEEGYTPALTPLTGAGPLKFAPTGGRPSDGAFPYFRIQFEGHGATLAVGWPAQWSAAFAESTGGATVQAGQEHTCLVLTPGERIRTPRITLLFWSGESTRGVNLWRRWYLAHVLPRPDGAPLGPLLSCSSTDEGVEFTGATEENQLDYQARFKEKGIDFDVWWIDAGWYPCRKAEHGPGGEWWNTGTWIADPARFPNGVGPVGDQARTMGARLLLWFEPERVTSPSALWSEHPEWLLKVDPQGDALLNLGDPACRQWLTDHVCALIDEARIGVYRQDFNFPPLEYWRASDAPDRQGMSENLHVQGYLRFWDDLLARNPGLWIDSCSSGGRRNDLETMRRSVPLHYSDYGYGLHAVKLAFHRTLYEWIPYFKDVTLSWDTEPGADGQFENLPDSYSVHCAMAGMLALGMDIRRSDYDFDDIKRLIALWRKAAPFLLYGDYYPMTEFSRYPEKWLAWQFDRPETGEGIIQVIRHGANPEDAFILRPPCVVPECVYEFENIESGRRFQVTGVNLLRDGTTAYLSARSGAIFFYTCKR